MLDPKDIRVDVYRYGPIHDRAVKAVHVPTGISVTIDDELTIYRAKNRALSELEILVNQAKRN